jgi:hypothetical protein
MSAIGGYFGLELNKKNEYHSESIRLNTGRNALEYILTARSYEKVYVPYYTCDVLLEPIKKLNLSHEFYFIDELFEPIFDFSLIKENECFLYTNYFGIKDDFISTLKTKCANLIIDNAQAFYAKPLENIDTFYSPRKFFGVADGAYLYTNKTIETEFEKDISYQRFEHLLRRIDINAEDGYSFFKNNDNSLSNMPILRMSNLTQRILSSIDYHNVALLRRKNYNYLYTALKSLNKINFKLNSNQVPMVYPLYTDDLTLRKRLSKNRLYTAQYWINVLNWADEDSLEYKFTTNIIHLPIDQRYSEDNLDKIVKVIFDKHSR